ncbi:hypothetical protein SY89_00150 [Halolamina pelagica]|uniref:Sulfatase n=1 Tax=Halolamina pelagica TaxID=699431 RepID=A0A0P7GV84_9EURY|nr:hypothetical protein [Halolamina pelagica]KPN29437.1 hypothetical protein SY89_00150 [Halolamina pelagica]
MNTSERILRALRNPRLFARGINRAYHRRAGMRSEYPKGIAVFEEDWDTLVVLDACRYDMFEEVANIEGDLSSQLSKASATVEWLSANFDGVDLRDTVYVTANPQLERNRESWNISLHETINVWLNEGWDEETGTVLAETMTEAAIEAHNRFPNKRIVVHYMQPHYPFVPSSTSFDKDHLREIDEEGGGPDGENVWGKKFTGQLSISQQDIWEIYLENLKYVVKHVKDLFRSTSGKRVVTSDHGNYVGERASPVPIREYGHPRGLYDDPVIQIPWLENTKGERREISTDRRDTGEDIDSGLVDERLRNLGYKTE